MVSLSKILIIFKSQKVCLLKFKSLFICKNQNIILIIL